MLPVAVVLSMVLIVSMTTFRSSLHLETTNVLLVSLNHTPHNTHLQCHQFIIEINNNNYNNTNNNNNSYFNNNNINNNNNKNHNKNNNNNKKSA